MNELSWSRYRHRLNLNPLRWNWCVIIGVLASLAFYGLIANLLA